MYRTGDLARERSDGVIEFRGRTDDQVKIHGHRIELAEIDAVLRSDPAVSAAAVLLDRSTQDATLCACYVGTIEPSTLREVLRTTLPEHMVPAKLVKVDRMPLTDSGKIDRDTLSALASNTPEQRPALSSDRPPSGEIELAIAECWSSVLPHPAVSAGDTFFDVGGNSLLTMRLMARLERTFGLEIPLSILFTSTTIRAQAAALTELATLQVPSDDRSVAR